MNKVLKKLSGLARNAKHTFFIFVNDILIQNPYYNEIKNERKVLI